MIRHMVLVRFQSNVEASVKRSIFAQLNDLRNDVTGIVDFQSGANVSPESDLIRGYQDLFWIDFVDAEARDAYLSHPAHLVAGARLVNHTEGGKDGILVADIEC